MQTSCENLYMAGLGGRLGQAGPEQRGFWSVGSRQPSAASSGARREDGLEAPSLCLPFCHAPQSSGPAPPPRPHRWGCLGRGQRFASEGMAGGGCFWAPMRGWQQNGKGFSAPPSPTQVLRLPRYPEVSLRTLCFQEHQAPEPQLCLSRSPPGLSILPWQSWLGRDTSWELDEAPCG